MSLPHWHALKSSKHPRSAASTVKSETEPRDTAKIRSILTIVNASQCRFWNSSAALTFCQYSFSLSYCWSATICKDDVSADSSAALESTMAVDAGPNIWQDRCRCSKSPKVSNIHTCPHVFVGWRERAKTVKELNEQMTKMVTEKFNRSVISISYLLLAITNNQFLCRRETSQGQVAEGTWRKSVEPVTVWVG